MSQSKSKAVPIEDLAPSQPLDEVVTDAIMLDGKRWKSMTDELEVALERIKSEASEISDLGIDRFNLDQELERQAQAMMLATTLSALAVSWWDYLYQMDKGAHADLADGIRRDLQEEGAKYSEAMISNLVSENKCLQVLADFKTQWAYWKEYTSGLKESLIQRASSLNKLASLWENEYWVSDSTKRKGK